MNARSVGPRGESHFTEMTGNHALGDVVPADSFPSNDIFGRHQDAAVRPRATACAAKQAVELRGVIHGRSVARSRVSSR